MSVKRVLCNGVFDVLHPGHISHLKQAAMLGNLVVGLTEDAFVGKPGRPIQTYEERAEMLESLRCVVFVFPCRDAVQAILTAMPGFFVKGPDYAEKGLLPEEIDACKKVGAEIRFTTAPKQSTTDLIERIRACK